MSTDILLAIALAVAGQAQADELVLAENGQSDYRIVTAPDAGEHLKLAATELQTFLLQISEAQLPIVSADEPLAAREIILGDNAHLRRVLPEADVAALVPDGFIIRTVGEDLVIAGSDDRGTLYGVYSFLEDVLGCRWWTPTASYVPRLSPVVVPEIDRRDEPALAFREVYYQGAMEPMFALRHKLNGNASIIRDGRTAREIHPGWGFWCHSFFTLVPPDRYFSDHPEFFSEIDGKRVRDGQLCLTNPDVLEIVSEDLKRRMDAAPELHTWSVSQNDWARNCHCERCRAIDEREGTPMGSLLEFINKLAARFPDKTISTLSYQYTRRPPRTLKPAPNVLIMLCSIECNRSRPIATDPSSADFREDVQRWAEICDNVFVWDYVVQFANLVSPFPNLRVLQPDVQFFVENHAKGLFSQGNRERGGEFAELRAYLLAKLHWNPDCDIQAAMAEFIQGYYGPAGDPIARYIALQHDELERSGADLRIFAGPAQARESYLTPELVTRYEALFDEAERLVAQDPELLLRVRTARMPLQYAILQLRYGDIAERQQVAERLFATAGATGLLMFNEWNMPTERFKTEVAEGFRRERLMDARIELKSGELELEVAPGHGGRITSLRMGSGDNLLGLGHADDWSYPHVGGYYESWSDGARGPGMAELFEPAETDTADGKRLELTLNTEQVAIARTLTVPAQGEWFEINSTATPSAGQPASRALWSRLCLTLGPVHELTAVAPAMGEAGVVALAPPRGDTQRDIWLAPEQLAQGVTIANHARSLALRLTPLPGTAEVCWLHVDGKRQQVTFGSKGLGGEAERRLGLRVELLTDLAGIPQTPEQRPPDVPGRILCQANRLFLENYGNEAWLEADPTATGGWCARMAPNHNMWCLAWFYEPAQFETDTSYEVFARIKVDKKGEAGPAFWAGVYDELNRTGVGQVTPPVADVPDGEWKLYKLATVTPGKRQYAWCGPMNNPDNVEALWLDYFEFRPVTD